MPAPTYGGKPKSGTNGGVTTDAAALAASAYCTGLVAVQADPDNTDDVFVGDSANQDTQLSAGQSADVPTNDLADVFVKSASGTQRVNYLYGT